MLVANNLVLGGNQIVVVQQINMINNVKVCDYARYIRSSFKIDSEIKPPWAFFFNDKVRLRQGWKIHVSAVPNEALDIIDVIAPILVKEKIPFKVVRGTKEHLMINSGLPVETALGKFMTIYPKSDRNSIKLALKLSEITDNMHGPNIPTDIKIGNIVYVRYGAFKPYKKIDRFGRSILFIRGPDGKLYEDNRAVPFRPPFPINIPAEFVKKSSSFIYPDKERKGNYNATIVGNKYLIVEIIRSRITGSIFGAIDTNLFPVIRPVMLKQAKKYCIPDKIGGDALTRLKNQEKFHLYLSNKIPVPRTDGFFEENDIGYLPIDYIKGKTILNYIENFYFNHSFKSVKELNSRKKIIITSIVDILARLHALKVVHGDFNPQNLIIDKNDVIWIIDFESAHFEDEPSPNNGTGTPGFNSPQQRKKGETEMSDDVYSLGATILYILTGLHPETTCYSSNKEGLFLISSRNIFSKKLAKILALCLSEDWKKRPSAMEILELIKDEVNLYDGRGENEY
jgi:hypothetical protein